MSCDIGVQPAVASRRQQLVWINRLLLVAAAVAFCHCFQWMWLRALTQNANLTVDSWFGVYMHPLSATTITFRGLVYRYQVSCTLLDVWFGLIPLLWSQRRSNSWNIGHLMLWAGVLFVFNILRLSISDVLFAHGLPWWLAHGAFSGVCYYVVWRAARLAMLREAPTGAATA
jgi:hypothetical protein